MLSTPSTRQNPDHGVRSCRARPLRGSAAARSWLTVIIRGPMGGRGAWNGGSVLTERWLGDWATRLQAAVDRALREVVSQFPFEASDHRVGPAVSATELGLLRRRVPWTPDDLIALHRHVGPVTLPDINN